MSEKRWEPSEKSAPARRRAGWSEVPAWAALVSLLVFALPLFLCLSIWCDTTYYGIWAWEILRGKVLERELNAFCKPPAMAWVLTVPMALVGWRPVAVRVLDVAIVTGIIWLLVRWLKPLGFTRASRVWTAVALYAFYFSTGEWCHAQPDTWMMLPALGALYFRRQQVIDCVTERGTRGDTVLGGLAEGFLWGLACLFKPFIVVPGGLVWLLGAVFVFRRNAGAVKRLGLGTLGLLAGGLAAGGIWMAWLWIGGGWPYFWEDFAIWSGGYYHVGPAPGRRSIYLFTQFFPWGLLNGAGLVIAAGAAWRVFSRRAQPKTAVLSIRVVQEGLLAGFYLGWLVVGNYVQFQLDYHLIPPMLAVITLVVARCPVVFRGAKLAGRRWLLVRLPGGRVTVRAAVGWGLLLVVVGLVALAHPLLRSGRRNLWVKCVREGSTPEIRDDLAQKLNQGYVIQLPNVQPYYFNLGGFWDPGALHSDYLEDVARFLRKRQVGDGELICWGTQAHALYLELNVAPPGRLLFPRNLVSLYKDKADLIMQEMNAHIGRVRFVVSDLTEVYAGNPIPPGECKNPKLPDDFAPSTLETFPWYEPIVFRAGPYFVHRVSGPVRAIHE